MKKKQQIRYIDGIIFWTMALITAIIFIGGLIVIIIDHLKDTGQWKM